MNRLIMPTLYALCSLSLHVPTASAKPSEVSQYLMDSPVSKMTWGLDHLSRYLNDRNKFIGVDWTTADYDSEADIIIIGSYCVGCGLEATEQACSKVISS